MQAPNADQQDHPFYPRTRATTVLVVRRDGRLCMASDGQVTLGDTVAKSTAAKVKRVGKDNDVLVGFAGGAADGLALIDRFEEKLGEFVGNVERAVVELSRDWRMDRALRQLQALIVVADKSQSFFVSGNGDLMQPDEDGIMAIGSGGNYALSAARALVRHTELSARQVVEEAMRIAASICIYTNDHLTIEEL